MTSTGPVSTPLLRVWPWVLAALVLVGTAGSNRAEVADAAGPFPVAVLLMAVAMTPAVLPDLAIRLGLPHGLPLLATGLATGAYFALGFGDGPVFLAMPAVTFVVAVGAPVRRWLGWAGAGVVPVCLGMLGRYLWWQPGTGHQHFWQAVGAVAIVAAAGAAGAALRSRGEARAERVERTATAERLRMAQELHDGVGHGLSVIAMQAGVALHVLDRDPAKARASLEAIRATSKESLDALRTELAALSSSGAGESAPRRPTLGTADLAALVDRVRGAGLQVEVAGDPGALPEVTGEVVYAVVQEALTNVLRHAAASRARVWFERPDGARLVVGVTDDGRGAGGAATVGTGGTGPGTGLGTGPGTGLGIPGMRSRVEGLGGTLQAGPGRDRSGDGFEVRAELPLATEEVRR